MADTTTLLQALQAGLERPTDTGYGIGAQVVASGIPAISNNPYASTGSNMAHAIGGSLLGGLLAGYARQSSAETNAELMPLMNQMLLAKTPEDRMAIANTSTNPGRLSPLVQALAMEDYSSNRKVQDNINSKMVDFQYNPQIKAAEQKALIPLENQQKIDQGIGDLAMQQGYVVDNGNLVPVDNVGLKTPIELEAEKARAVANAKAEAEAEQYGFNPKREEEVDKLRKEFNALQQVKDFAQVEKSASVINEALDDPSAMSDLELVRYSILLIEPGMAVREGEQAAVLSSQSIPASIKGRINKTFNEGAELGPQAREALRNLAKRAYKGNKEQYDRTLGFYQNEATAKGIDPNRISYIGESKDLNQIFGQNENMITGTDGIQYRIDHATKQLIPVR